MEECIELLVSDPEARLIAGGTDLGVESNLRQRRWPHLVSLEAIGELRAFEESAESVRIGASLPLTDMEAQWASAPAAFRTWFPLFASPMLRNRATIGGSLATASPIGDSAPLLLAFDARVHIAGRAGRRVVDLADFFEGYRKTALQGGELITAIEIPKPFPMEAAFYKAAKRRMDDISTVAAAFALDLDNDGRIVSARFAFGGVAAVPLRVTSAEQAVLGRRWNESTMRGAQNAITESLRPISDHRGSAGYRLAVAASLLEKFYWRAQEEAA
ncbi:MAG: FAD binding domain-containing protein [Acidobacteriota bacterium]